MVSKNNSPGMFARVANFVRNPVAATGSESRGEDQESAQSSAQTIKRVLERKAHNDAVRRREFAQLRKLRHASAEEAVALVARDSFFLDSSSFQQLEERALTLKKIDEIEAQMSKQWWKTRQDSPVQAAKQPEPAPGELPDEDDATPGESLVSFAPTVPADFEALSGPRSSQTGANTSVPLNGAAPRSRQSGKAKSTPARTFELTGNSAFSASKLMTVEMGQTLSDPTLEDAAIRFANGDDAGAEAVLLEGLRGDQAEASSREAWSAALFDLYRGLGLQQRFDVFALDYAQRCGRTAPPWFSTPQVLSGLASGASIPLRGQAVGGAWVCPDVADALALSRLDRVLGAGSNQLLLDWRQFVTVSSDLAPTLAALLHRCSEQPFSLQILGEDVLAKFLLAQTPVGNNRVDRAWWLARMDWLRLLGRQSEFEAASMDYCITYEVSPPVWQVVKCSRNVPADADVTGTFDVTARNDLDADAQMEFKGELKGDMGVHFSKVSSAGSASMFLSVDCERLIRVDFAAAGSILNWTAARRASGQKTEFVQVPRLVAAFFSLIGINEHVRIMVRAN